MTGSTKLANPLLKPVIAVVKILSPNTGSKPSPKPVTLEGCASPSKPSEAPSTGSPTLVISCADFKTSTSSISGPETA